MQFDTFTTAVELKFVDDSAPGTFEGYGAVFGNIDSHGDIVTPGAFAESLAQHKAGGTMPALHVEHDWAFGGDPLPAGVWSDLSEDGQGLRAKGKISALDTDYGRRVHSLMKDGALKGLSIAYQVPSGGSEHAKKGEPHKRLLKRVDLHALDIVKFPSNRESRIESIKGVLRNADAETATRAAASAIALHRATMSGSDSPSADERTKLMSHLQDIHEALTGKRMPDGMKADRFSTVREFEAFLRDEAGLTNSQARLIAESGFKALAPRDEVGGEAIVAVRNALTGFSLPTF